MSKKPATPARAVGVRFQGAIEFAVMRGDKTIDRITASTENVSLYDAADARRWLVQVEKLVAQRLAEVNAG